MDTLESLSIPAMLPKSFAPLSQQTLNLSKVDDLMLIHGRYNELSEV